jgi:hypothetical protein
VLVLDQRIEIISKLPSVHKLDWCGEWQSSIDDEGET